MAQRKTKFSASGWSLLHHSSQPLTHPEMQNGIPLQLDQTLTVGRGPTCEVQLPSLNPAIARNISRLHAQLHLSYSPSSTKTSSVSGDDETDEQAQLSCWIKDLSTTNGVFVNRIRIPADTQINIKVGDIVAFGGGAKVAVGGTLNGDYEFTFRVTQTQQNCTASHSSRGDINGSSKHSASGAGSNFSASRSTVTNTSTLNGGANEYIDHSASGAGSNSSTSRCIVSDTGTLNDAMSDRIRETHVVGRRSVAGGSSSVQTESGATAIKPPLLLKRSNTLINKELTGEISALQQKLQAAEGEVARLRSVDQVYEALEESLTCAVCLELPSSPLALTCSHVFCQECWKDWAQRSGSATTLCPTCRAEIVHEPIPVLSVKHTVEALREARGRGSDANNFSATIAAVESATSTIQKAREKIVSVVSMASTIQGSPSEHDLTMAIESGTVETASGFVVDVSTEEEEVERMRGVETPLINRSRRKRARGNGGRAGGVEGREEEEEEEEEEEGLQQQQQQQIAVVRTGRRRGDAGASGSSAVSAVAVADDDDEVNDEAYVAAAAAAAAAAAEENTNVDTIPSRIVPRRSSRSVGAVSETNDAVSPGPPAVASGSRPRTNRKRPRHSSLNARHFK